jgi:hypothetical protein
MVPSRPFSDLLGPVLFGVEEFKDLEYPFCGLDCIQNNVPVAAV